MAESKTPEALAKERAEKAPLTGVLTSHDVLRHLATVGPARNEAERAELLGVVNANDPDYTEPEHVMTSEEKAREYDRLQAENKARQPATVSQDDRPGGQASGVHGQASGGQPPGYPQGDNQAHTTGGQV
jgi:hypothetical protein